MVVQKRSNAKILYDGSVQSMAVQRFHIIIQILFHFSIFNQRIYRKKNLFSMQMGIVQRFKQLFLIKVFRICPRTKQISPKIYRICTGINDAFTDFQRSGWRKQFQFSHKACPFLTIYNVIFIHSLIQNVGRHALWQPGLSEFDLTDHF